MSISTHSIGYRDDITGLRALAVLIVCAYHFGINSMSGGFVGVDVFFVISGFVITRMIREEFLRTGTFDFGRFYLRRVRRLMPALVATVALTFLVGAIVLSPSNLEKLARSAFGALLSFSNILFWRESGYFDASAISKPLLHTWSLSVEEQFYLLWPALLVAVLSFAKRWEFWAIAAIGVVSFAGNFLVHPLALEAASGLSSRIGGWLATKGSSTIFYLTPFRVFEFVFGALVVWLLDKKPAKIVAEVSVASGLVLICFCVATYQEAMLFPSYNALLPCVGTALVVYGGNESRLAQGLLANRIAVRLGEISYAVYLAHWPLVVFLADPLAPLPAGVRLLVLSVATILLAYALHELVEKRFRRPRSQAETLIGSFGAACALSIGLVLVPSALAAAGNGWAWRLPAEVRDIADSEKAAAEQTINSHNTDRPYDRSFADDGRTRILIIGDSMADDLSLSLRQAGWQNQLDIEVINISHTCLALRADRSAIPGYDFGPERAEECNSEVDGVIYAPILPFADVVVLTHNWYPWVPEVELQATFKEFRSRTDRPIYVIGKRRWFDREISKMVIDRGTLRFANSDAFQHREDGGINSVVARAAAAADLNFVDWEDLVCLDSEAICLAVAEGKLLYRDRVHFTIEGARLFGERMAMVESFREMFLGPH